MHKLVLVLQRIEEIVILSTSCWAAIRLNDTPRVWRGGAHNPNVSAIRPPLVRFSGDSGCILSWQVISTPSLLKCCISNGLKRCISCPTYIYIYIISQTCRERRTLQVSPTRHDLTRVMICVRKGVALPFEIETRENHQNYYRLRLPREYHEGARAICSMF